MWRRLTVRGVLALWSHTCTESDSRRNGECVESTGRHSLRFDSRTLLEDFTDESGNNSALAGPPVLSGGAAYVATTQQYETRFRRVPLRNPAAATNARVGAGTTCGSVVWLGGGRAIVTRGGLIGPSEFELCPPGSCGHVELVDGLYQGERRVDLAQQRLHRPPPRADDAPGDARARPCVGHDRVQPAEALDHGLHRVGLGAREAL